jgi:ABC-type uncharacterized transport system auxiliary subunit
MIGYAVSFATRLIQIALSISLLSLISACSLLGPAKTVEVKNYEIMLPQNMRISTDQNQVNGKVIDIPMMQADPPFNTNKIYYSQTPYQISSYNYNQWSVSPAEMLTTAVANHLDSREHYTIVPWDISRGDKYKLHLRLQQLIQDMDDSPSSQTSWARLSVKATLINTQKANKIRARHTFNMKRKTDATARGMVSATNALTKQLVQQLTRWLNEHIDSNASAQAS